VGRRARREVLRKHEQHHKPAEQQPGQRNDRPRHQRRLFLIQRRTPPYVHSAKGNARPNVRAKPPTQAAFLGVQRAFLTVNHRSELA
jgi:hypothetical protein